MNRNRRVPGPHQRDEAPSGSGWDLFLLAAVGLLLVSQARAHVFVPMVPSLRPGLLLTAFALVLWIMRPTAGRNPARLFGTPLTNAAWFVVIWAMVGVPFAISLGGSARFLLDDFSRTFLVFLIIAAAVRNTGDVRRMVGALAFGGALFAVMAPVERGLGATTGGYDPNDAAMFVVTAIPALAFFVLFGRRKWIRLAAAVAGAGAIGAVVHSQSRGGFLALVAVMVCMLFTLKAVRPAVRIGVAVLVIAAAIPVASSEYVERMQTITEFDDGYGSSGIGGRRNIWTRGVGYAWANPVTGIGAGQFPRMERQFRLEAGARAAGMQPHSMWIQAVAELGFPGLLAFFGMFVLAVTTLWRIQASRWHPPPPFRPGEFQAMAGFLMASVVGAMVAGSFLSHLYGGLTWCLIALVVGLEKTYRLGAQGRASPQRAVRSGGPRPGSARVRKMPPQVRR